MLKYQICKLHQEQVQFISRDVNNNEFIGNCRKCMPLPQGVPYQPLHNVLINIENNKISMIRHFEEEKDYNVKIIRLIQNIIIRENKNAIHQGELEIQKIEKKCNLTQRQIKEYIASSFDIADLINLFNTLQNENSLQLTQQSLLEQVIYIQQQSFLLEAYQILQQLPKALNLDLFNEENPNNLKKYYKCPKHNKILLGVDLKQSFREDQNNSCFVCTLDLQNATLNFTELDEAEKKWSDYHKNSKPYYKKLQNLVQNLITRTIIPIQDKYNIVLRKMEKCLLILDKFKNSQLYELNYIIKSLKFSQLDFSSVEDLQKLKKVVQLSEDDWRFYDTEIKSFFYFFEQRQNKVGLRRVNEFIKLIMNGQISKVQQVKIQFNSISSVQQQEGCYALAINTQGNILVAGCNEQINVFQFNFGFLKQQQKLVGHLANVNCLQFIQDQNTFVSASDDKTSKIWKQQSVNNWIVTQTLQGHTKQILCLVINLSGDQIFTGGEDKSIRFWNQDNQEWSNQQRILDHQKEVWNLSLNESENQLISCGGDDLILVMEQSQKSLWTVIQKIKTAFGLRLCFLANDVFSFQPKEGYMQIFKFNTEQKLFAQIKCIEVNENKNIVSSHFLFPSKFIKLKQILISKHKNYLNVIREVQNEEFQVDQCIDFKVRQHYGTISNDGEYLVTWDVESKEIQVRKSRVVIESK